MKAKWLLATLTLGLMSCASETVPEKAGTDPDPVPPVKAPPDLTTEVGPIPEGGPTPEGAPTPIRLGMPMAAYLHGVAWITEEAGFFDEHDLDVSIEVLRGDRSVATKIAEGEFDVALCSATGVITANLAGGDLVIFAGLVNRLALRVFTLEGIETPEDLVGKAVGVPVLGSPQDWAFRVLMYRSGLDYQDLVVRALGGDGDFLGALDRGNIRALASARPPQFIENRGGRVLADIPDPSQPFPFINLVADRAWLLNRRGAALALTRAICDGIRYYTANREMSLKILKPHLAGSIAAVPGMEEEHYDGGGPHLFTYPPYPNLNGLRWLFGQFERRDGVSTDDYSAEDFVEAGILQQLETEGYFSDDEDERDDI